jgi:hypothetical protein
MEGDGLMMRLRVSRTVRRARTALIAALVVAAAAVTFVAVIPTAHSAEQSTSSVAVAHNRDGRLQMFVADKWQRVQYRQQTTVNGQDWTPWRDFMGALSALSEVAAEINGEGRIEVFGVNRGDGKLYHRWQLAPDSDSWSGWVEVATAMSTITVTRGPQGGMVIFGTDPQGRIWGRTQYTATTWSPWGQLDGTMTSVAAETGADGRVQLFGSDGSGAVYHRWELAASTGSYSRWQLFATAMATVAVSFGPRSGMQFYGTDPQGRVWARIQYTATNGDSGGTWSPWNEIAGPPLTQIAADSNADGRMALIGVNAADRSRVYHRAELSPNSGTWSRWVEIGQEVLISSSGSRDRDTFLDAVGTPGMTVRIAGHVNLDLSGLESIRIAPGVQIIGDRSVNPRGPRLYTTTIPSRLFLIGGSGDVSDDVRISGIRLDGGRGNVIAPANATGGTGISVISSLNVEIDHNEIYGWQGTAVWVDDELDRISLANATTVRIHDNYIHRNQHYREEGYGVATHGGAYALIERNVFDYNRHALEGDGRTGTGYLAYRNLFLAGGGVNSEPAGGLFEVNTHMLDMHGTRSCLGFVAYCGQAGEYMDIQYNTILYTAGTAFKLRGDPTVRADVGNNVFAHSQVWGGWLDDAAMVGTNNNLGINAWNNQFGLNTFNERRTCDFDGDGAGDAFIATGITWWYASSKLAGRWVYLNDSRKRVANVSVGDVTGDGRCDVTADGVVYDNGRSSDTPITSPNPVPDIKGLQLAEALTALSNAGYRVGAQFDVFDTPACARIGQVVDQDPPPGTASLPRGPVPTVNIWVMQRPRKGACG